MSAERHVNRSLIIAAACAVVIPHVLVAQETVQKLLERGALDEAVQRAESDGGNPESTYLAAQALAKMDNAGGAGEQYARLRESGDASWKAIGESGVALTAGNHDAAMDAANRAVAASGDNAYAHYQVGIVASRQNDFARAAAAFDRATQLKPDFAYAHYYAGLANQRVKQVPKMSEHLETFLRLAPDAPERSAVAAILRTLRR